MFVSRPVVQHNRHKVDLVDTLLAEGLTFGDEFGTKQVINAVGLTSTKKNRQFVNQLVAKRFSFSFESFVHLDDLLFIFLFLLAILNGTGIEFFVNDDTIK